MYIIVYKCFEKNDNFQKDLEGEYVVYLSYCSCALSFENCLYEDVSVILPNDKKFFTAIIDMCEPLLVCVCVWCVSARVRLT